MVMYKRHIAVIGAGQSGLQLAIHLLSLGSYKVSLFSERSAEEIKSGSIMSSQVMFDTALKNERMLGLNFWDAESPKNENVTFSLAIPGSNIPAIYWQGNVKVYQSIDQRIKFSRWLEVFEEMGGDLLIQSVNQQSLNSIAQHHDLTIVTTGKGEVNRLFPENKERSLFSSPQRALSCLYVKDMIPAPEGAAGVRVNVIPGVGEYFTTPGLTHNGHCEMMLFEGIPNGPLDCWGTISSPEEHLEKAKELLKMFVPWEADRCAYIQLTDAKATLLGQYTPTIRHPVVTLPCGESILGLGDAVVLNDPIAGQGANHAGKTAYLYAERIQQRGEAEFDETWMNETAELAWNLYGKYSTQLSTLLLAPPSTHMIEALKAAENNQKLADQLANGFNDPDMLIWLSDSTAQIIPN